MCAFTLLQIYYIFYEHTKSYRTLSPIGEFGHSALKFERDHSPNIKDCELEHIIISFKDYLNLPLRIKRHEHLDALFRME